MDGKTKADWIFKAKKVRNNFHENLDLVKVKEEIETFNIDTV